MASLGPVVAGAGGVWVTLLTPGSDRARTLCRRLRRLGAGRINAQGRRVQALLPEGSEARRGLERLARELGCAPPAWGPAGPEGPPPEALEPGAGLCLVPAWCPPPPGRRALRIDALTAFGAGDHPSTMLNLMLLAGLAEEGWRPGEGALWDVGAGSGILALAMAAWWGRPVAALDPEPAAMRALARNRELNPGPGALVHPVRGYHHCLAGEASLIAANLPTGIILAALPHMARHLAAQGRMALSGFRDEFAPGLLELAYGLGLEQVRRAGRVGWAGLLLAPA